MKHIVITEYGTTLGITSQRVVVKNKGEVIKEYPLSRLSTITIAKDGVSFSSNLIKLCSLRGIKIFFISNTGKICSALYGVGNHGGVGVRERQFITRGTILEENLSKALIHGKIKNQRAVLGYFGKYLTKKGNGLDGEIKKVLLDMKIASDSVWFSPVKSDWRGKLLGIEGSAAKLYFETLFKLKLLDNDLSKRVKRGAEDLTNISLNYGYGILRTYIWNAIVNAGLVPYAGILHKDRSGKPSLVLDLMEEYRAWVVDRVIIKNRQLIAKSKKFEYKLKRRVIEDIQKTCDKKYLYNKKKLSLESIIQRQVYKFCGSLGSDKRYKPYQFKW